jgi:acyl dehydratase
LLVIPYLPACAVDLFKKGPLVGRKFKVHPGNIGIGGQVGRLFRRVGIKARLCPAAVMKFDEFAVGRAFSASITITKEEFDRYISFARTRNVLHENPELAAREGITGVLLPGRSIIARAEGEMTRLSEFADCIMLLYGMDGDPQWAGRQTRFMGEAYAGETLEVKYTIAGKKEEKGDYGILRVDYEINKAGKPVVVSRGNLYRIKK